MGDTGGKSGRRPGRHLQVEASGPGNAASVQQRLAGRFRGGEIDQGRTCAVWLQVGAPELSSGPVWEIQEVSLVAAAPRASPPSRSFWPGKCRECAAEACGSIRGKVCGRRWLRRARLQSRCAGALLGTCRRDIGGKSGRRPGRHLQVEASGPANAASVQHRLAGRFGGKFEAAGGCAGPGGKVDAPELSSGPGWEIQEVSRVGAQGVTSKSKLLAREMPRVCSRGLQVDSGGI